ncbi:MAG: MgtC/SapB family protein [Planctomycetia bacterium]|nr:MgtC/SapB family protein [Planctomycetia bacterium]
MDWNTELLISLRLGLAGFLGGLIGLDRELTGHPAGARTHATVALGSCLFSLVSVYHGQAVGGDQTRIAAQVVSGIGFIGAGVIMRDRFRVKGLTTAASLWTTASIGMAAGYGYYVMTCVASALVMSVLFLQYLPWWQRLTLVLEKQTPNKPRKLTKAQKRGAYEHDHSKPDGDCKKKSKGESTS